LRRLEGALVSRARSHLDAAFQAALAAFGAQSPVLAERYRGGLKGWHMPKAYARLNL